MKMSWSKLFVCNSLVLLLCCILIVVYYDPFFHYHAPLEDYEYRMNDERYQNDGILRNFTYDAIIIGTSLVHNFHTSELDQLMGSKSVKVPFSGASYKEIGDNLSRACEYNKDLKSIVWGLDYAVLSDPPDSMRYESYPDYLYNDSVIDDVNYVLNKQVLFSDTYLGVIDYTKTGLETPTFDKYRGDDKGRYGKELVLQTYKRKEKQEEKEEKHLDGSNIRLNVLKIIDQNPQIDFYLFFPPYSILFFDQLNQKGELKNQLLQEKEAIELLINHDNVHLFSFYDDFDIIVDFDNYMDYLHYNTQIASYIIDNISKGEHELNKTNYLDYCNKCKEYYLSYDYDSIFE